MTNDQEQNQTTLSEEVAQNPGARIAAIRANPQISQEEAENAAAGESPNASGMGPSTAEAHVPASSDPEATDLPTSNAPDPQAVNPKNPNAS
jgi:hypothetical protein